MNPNDPTKTPGRPTVDSARDGSRPAGAADDRGRNVTADAGADEMGGSDQDIDTAGTEADDTTGGSFVPADKVFLQDEGLRRAEPAPSAGNLDRDSDTDKHTEATMPPGEGREPKRNTM